MENRNDSLGILLHEAARAVRKAFERRVSRHGLSSAQWRMLVTVTKCAEATTQARLADLLEIEPISVSRLVDRMEAAGWVERRPDPQDRRVKLVVPTDRARAVHAEIRAMADDVYGEALGGLAPEQRVALLGGLSRVIANLNEAAGQVAQGVKQDDNR
jgi:DNA-binding MarR family transcriptional regulator